MSVQLKATARYLHRGQFVRGGDIFEADEAEARDLLAMQMAQVVEQTLAQRVAEAVVDALGDIAPAMVKRKYQRRDLTAE
jgi:hypothetical protein